MTSSSKHPLIGKRINVGTHGFVQLIDFMGSDQDIAEAAWVSTDFGNLNRSPVPQFLDYLMRHGHWSPFEMCSVKFRVYVPLAVEAQWVTHRTAKKNQASARYVILPDNNFEPTVWRSGSTGHNKQGSGEPIEQQDRANAIYQGLIEHARSVNKELLDLGVAPELARFTQLQSQYTMKVWKMDLRNLLNFLTQRTDSHAQEEIRDYADVIERILCELFPEAMHAWKNHIKYAVRFSREEQEVLGALLLETLAREASLNDGMTPEDVLEERLARVPGMRKSRRDELAAKLLRVLEVA